MSLFCGATCKCKRKCKGWFSHDPDLERGCKNACKADSSLTKDSFLCSGNWVDQVLVMGSLGYDPCPNDDITYEDYLDPLNDRKREDSELSDYTGVIVGFGAILALAVMALLYIKVR